MSFAAPLALFGLLALPLLYFLLRLTPPAPRRVVFPPLALLRDLGHAPRTPAHTPLLIRLLRLGAAALIILGCAGPALNPPPLGGSGPVLLVIDNGWASAATWPQFLVEARGVIAAAGAAHRDIAILPTAAPQGGKPLVIPPADAASALGALLGLSPQPWPPDRAAAAVTLAAAPETTRIYLSDNVRTGGDAVFLHALHAHDIRAAAVPPPLLGPVRRAAGAFRVQALSNPTGATLIASTAAGAVLGEAAFDARGDASIALPAPLAQQVRRLAFSGPPTAGGTALVGTAVAATTTALYAGSANAQTPYLGALYYLERALPPGERVKTGPLDALLATRPSLAVLADTPLSGAGLAAAQAYVAQGGVLLRFAGPLTASAPDLFNPDPLLPGDRRLGGALTWAAPEPLAPIPPGSPLAGLHTEPDTVVSRQTLADPQALDPATVWAVLPDGTPLILGAHIGRGVLVDVLTTANTDWSNLALSGLYPALLARLPAITDGAPARADAVSPLYLAMDGTGVLAAQVVPAHLSAGQRATPSPATPPGLYGSADRNFAFNLGDALPVPRTAAWPGATALGSARPTLALGPPLLATALALLLFDFAISLFLRGARPRLRAALMAIFILAATPPARADTPAAALSTTLAYIPGPDANQNQLMQDGLTALSAAVSAHSSVTLAPPAAVTPGRDDLAYYPLIYWLVAPEVPTPPPAFCAALAAYMAHGGLLVIDQAGGQSSEAGSGAGFAPDADAALARATACLALPPLEPLRTGNVLAHSFYIIHDFPGRFTGGPVFIANAAARDADGVTPVIVARNDWAGAWATDAQGDPEQSPIPGGEAQRRIAMRFGVNLVIYALTGSYKSDQNAAPALLDKLGP